MTNFERICEICAAGDKKALAEELEAWHDSGLSADGCYYDTELHNRYHDNMTDYLDSEIPI